MDTQPTTHEEHEPTPEEMMSGLFAYLVMQQTNMAMMLMGKVAHPETGKTVHDLDAAKLFVDQLEMLEVKTKGNLTKQEDALLKQSLMNLRLAFVESVEGAGKSEASPDSSAASEPSKGAAEPAAGATPKSTVEDESRKKFTKKY